MQNILKKQVIIIGILTMVLSVISFSGQSVSASTYKCGYTYHGKIKIGKVTFKGKATDDYSYDIVKIKNGKKKTILTDVGSQYVTNGKTIYYTKGSKPNRLYSYNVKSGKSKYILKIKANDEIMLEPMNAKGKYIYYAQSGVSENGSLYVYNTKTKQKKKLVNGKPNSVSIKGNQVYVRMQTLDVDEPVWHHVFTLSGKKIKSYIK